jgi:hypothetical protein
MLQYYVDESEVSEGLGASFNPLTAKSHHGSPNNAKNDGSTRSCTENPTIFSTKTSGYQ